MIVLKELFRKKRASKFLYISLIISGFASIPSIIELSKYLNDNSIDKYFDKTIEYKQTPGAFKDIDNFKSKFIDQYN